MRNSDSGADVPELPEGTKLVRIHVAGDFDSAAYIERWIEIAESKPEVKFWAYTRSWRVAKLLHWLKKLQALPNVQLFASMDTGTLTPPDGWRCAWISNDSRALGLICPEERGKVANCEQCGFCFKPNTKSVVFLPH
jgi:hypothetical protein